MSYGLGWPRSISTSACDGGVIGRHELTDAAWVRIDPLLPARPPVVAGGSIIDVGSGACASWRPGASWRDLPERYGHWKSVYERYRRWSVAASSTGSCVTCRSMTTLRAVSTGPSGLDSSIVRAHQHAVGARKRGTRRDKPASHRPLTGRVDHRGPPGRRRSRPALRLWWSPPERQRLHRLRPRDGSHPRAPAKTGAPPHPPRLRRRRTRPTPHA